MIRKSISLGSLVMVLAACGGGSSSDDTASQPNLVGTWIQTNDNFFTATGETFKLRRQTITVTDEGDYLEFTDCVSGDSLMARIDNDVVEFYSAGVPSLTIVNERTLRVALSYGSTQTEVELRKVSTDTSVVLADVAMSEPAMVSSWDQVCVETILDQYLNDEVKFKAVNERNGLAVLLNMEFDGDLAATTYDFSTGTNDADGSVIAADVFNPTGTITIVEGGTVDFSVDLEFENNVDNSLIPVVSTIEFDPTWFSYE